MSPETLVPILAHALLAVTLGADVPTDGTAPRGGPPEASTASPSDTRLHAGDAFTVDIKYSNVWNEVSLAVKGPAGTVPAGPEALIVSRVAASRITVSGIGADPLFVDMTLKGEVRGQGRFSLTPTVAEVRYFDDRNRKWSIKPATRGSREQAEKLVKDVAGQWRNVFPGSLDSEMLEEQLVGAAVCLLSGVPFDAAVVSWDSDPELPAFDEILKEKLPAEFPAALHKSVAWFFRESVARVIARAPEDLREKVGFDARGVPYTVEKVKATKGRATAEIAGQMHWTSTGAYLKESLVVDKGTGLILESKSITVRDALRGRDARFGAVRWETKLSDFRPAKETGAK